MGGKQRENPKSPFSRAQAPTTWAIGESLFDATAYRAVTQICTSQFIRVLWWLFHCSAGNEVKRTNPLLIYTSSISEHQCGIFHIQRLPAIILYLFPKQSNTSFLTVKDRTPICSFKWPEGRSQRYRWCCKEIDTNMHSKAKPKLFILNGVWKLKESIWRLTRKKNLEIYKGKNHLLKKEFYFYGLYPFSNIQWSPFKPCWLPCAGKINVTATFMVLYLDWTWNM